MKSLRIFVPILLLILSGLCSAQQSRGYKGVVQNDLSNSERVALVIGNSSYTKAMLVNPVNDARDMANALKTSDFRLQC